MDNKIKQSLTSNWFKILQDIICKEIEELEGKKKSLNQLFGIGEIKKMKVVENLGF